jgi:hypothetical protein
MAALFSQDWMLAAQAIACAFTPFGREEMPFESLIADPRWLLANG